MNTKKLYRRHLLFVWLLAVGMYLFGCKNHGVTTDHSNNRALVFDGVETYVDLGNIYDDLKLPVSISAWIWLDSAAADGLIPIFDSQDGLDVYNGFNFLTTKTSTIGAQYGDGRGSNHHAYRKAKSAVIFPVSGRWVNFTAVINEADDIRLYINGESVGGEYSGSSDQPMNSNSPKEVAKIGYMFQNKEIFRFKGKMDEFRIWNRALTQKEVKRGLQKKLNENEPGLIGYWDFDEPSGVTVIDHSKNHFNGIIKGDPQRVLSGVPLR